MYGRHANVWNINTRFNSRTGNMRKKESSHFHNLKPLLWRRSAVHWFPLVAYQPRSHGQGSSAYTHCRGWLDTYPKIWSFYHPLKYKYSVCLLFTLSTTNVVSPCQLFTSPAPLCYNTVYNVHTLYAIQHWSHLSVSIISKKSETKRISKVKLNGKCTFIKMYKKQFTPEYLSTCQRWDLKTSLVDLTDWAAANPKISPPVPPGCPGQITLLLRDGKDTLYGQNWTRPSLIWVVLGQSYKTHSHSICPAIHLSPSPWSNW